MHTLLRRIRGALGMGLTWAMVWAIPGFIPRWVLGIESDLPFGLLFAGLGFIAGVTFSAVLALTEGRRRFEEMSLPRFATWGAVGGLLLAALFVRGTGYSWSTVLAIGATFGVTSAACASGSLLLARRSERLSAGVEALPDRS